MRLIFSGGGTGGHIYPAIALIKKLRQIEKNIEILYIGKINAEEEKICQKENIPFKGIKVRYFYRKITLKNLLTITEFLHAYCQAKKIIKTFKPDIVIGMGGYVCAPVVYAAAKKNIPTIIHEQNSIPGLTNKFLARYATTVAISFPSSSKLFKKGNTILTGNPRAQEVMETKKSYKEALGLKPDKKLILIFMGSLGAEYVNQTVCASLPFFNERFDTELIFVTGKRHYDTIISEVDDLNLNENIMIKPYVDNMPQLYQHADLVICRAGATTLAEICAIGIPCILIPSPYVTNHHQEKNAQDLVNADAAIQILEKELTKEKLVKEVENMMNDPYKLRLLRINNKKFGIPDASDKFIELIKSLI